MDTHIHAPTDVFAIAKTEHLHSMLLCWRPVKRKYHHLSKPRKPGDGLL